VKLDQATVCLPIKHRLVSHAFYTALGFVTVGEIGDDGAVILPKDRDTRFTTVRRGGTLTDSDHRLLALWSAACAEHV